MHRKPFVSILTCIYNQACYVEQTIQSVLNQTYTNWEWIILDDGSTDNTGDIIRRYRNERIRYAFQEHAGVRQISKTFNKALHMCRGDLIATLDGDDYWPDNKLDIQVKNFHDPDAVLSYGESWLINDKGKRICYIHLPEDKSIACNNPLGSALKDLLLKRYCFLVNSTVMYRKSGLLNIGGFVEADGLFQDYPTWIRLSLEGKFTPIPFLLGYYRKHSSSLSLSNPEQSLENDIAFFKVFLRQHQEELSQIGLVYDQKKIESDWETIRTYLHYNTALYMLMIGSFIESQVAFKQFLKRMPSWKHGLIYYLIKISSLIRFDLVNPLSSLKSRIIKFLLGT
jgi:glycosyltransferase involved in cell wall biosynthesis